MKTKQVNKLHLVPIGGNEKEKKSNSNEKDYSSPVKTLSQSTEKSLSSPRRKRNPLSNLYSDLSPKYIGFAVSPKDNDDKRTRRFNAKSPKFVSALKSPIKHVKNKKEVLLQTPKSANHQSILNTNLFKTERRSVSQDINDNQIEDNNNYDGSNGTADIFKPLESNCEHSMFEIQNDFIKMEDASVIDMMQPIEQNLIEKLIPNTLTNSIDGYTNLKISGKTNEDIYFADGNSTPSPSSSTSCFDTTSEPPSIIVSNSLSTESRDSANGSSVDTESNIDIRIGGLFWGQMAQYPYWPCIVCPDPEGRTISVKGAKQHKQHAMIHVRFFADNGRRGWVKKTNLIDYEGHDSFLQKVDEIKKNFKPNKSKVNILKLFVINNPKNKKLWLQAIKEADLICAITIESRIEKFDEVVDNMKELSKASALSNRKLFKPNKRQRSSTPNSPFFEPIFYNTNPIAKKRKIASTHRKVDTFSVNKDLVQQYLNNEITENWNDNIEFNEFKDVLKLYVFGDAHNYNSIIDDKLNIAIRQIWKLKDISTKVLLNSNNGQYLGPQTVISTNKVQRVSRRLEEIGRGKTVKLTSIDHLPLVVKEKKIVKKPTVDEVIDAIFKLDKNYLFKGLVKGPICIVCRTPGDLVKCNGTCCGFLHINCASMKSVTANSDEINEALVEVVENQIAVATTHAICPNCDSDKEPICFVCRKSNDLRIRCHNKDCGKHFHSECLKYWPQAKFIKSSLKDDGFLCPAHICHTCVSDNPKQNFVEIEKSKLIRCIDCPATYHMDSTCIPAGSEFLTASQIICPKHFQNPKVLHVNVNWCFFCVKGGNLVCCETCPTAFHIECLHLKTLPEVFICEECETGRMPLYGEIVWAKFNNFRWWPSIIIPPPQVPENLAAKKRHPSEFLIRFFGTNDHGWINRHRVYLYQDGDFKDEHFKRSKKLLDSNYNRGIEEACRVAEMIKQKFPQKPSKSKKLKICPLPYFKLKVNRSVPPVRLIECDLSEVNVCECVAEMENPCGPESGCLNRVLLIECNPKVCPAGSRCQNQLFEKRSYPQLDIVYMNEKGFGLVCLQPISAGTFIVEYVGEVINDKELHKRIALKQHEKDDNYYYLTVKKDYIIDAGLKGNIARFMNHSCEPNCETQKWTVNGVIRVGLFALKDLPENTELTFNYYLECIGSDKKPCHCGAKRCAGYIGSKYVEPAKQKLNGNNDMMVKTKGKRTVGGQQKVKMSSKMKKETKKISNPKREIFVKLVPVNNN